jgi:uracil-DNA glycosylase family 4
MTDAQQKPKMTRFQLHIETWKNCTACPLHETRQNVVLARGKLPCDILFIGEGPGPSEDVCAQPFIGPAGQLLDSLIERALGKDHTYRIAFTNLVACIPLDERGEKFDKPMDEDIRACRPRLEEFLDIAKPKLIFCVGRLASDYAYLGWIPGGVYRADIDHPSYLLRMSHNLIAKQSIDIQRCVVTIRSEVGKCLAQPARLITNQQTESN